MDREFNTTFIPKKSLIKERVPETRKRISMLGFVALLIFVTVIISGAGVYLYKQYLIKNIEDMRLSLERSEKLFEPNVILDLKDLNIRLDAAKEILDNHISLSSFFNTLEQTTLKDIAFDNLEFSMVENIPNITMRGEGRRYTPIASQSILFEGNRFIENHIFSNFELTDKGRVSFDLDFTINKDRILYSDLFQNREEFNLLEEDEFLLEDNIIEY